jgi:hypothetical protein
MMWSTVKIVERSLKYFCPGEVGCNSVAEIEYHRPTLSPVKFILNQGT